MRILMIHRDLTVKQFHLACALTDRYGFKCYFMTTYPFGLNWKGFFKQFPHPRGMLYQLRYLRAFQANIYYTENPFMSVSFFNLEKIKDIDPDIIYFTHAVYDTVIPLKLDVSFVCDVEDSVLLDRDVLPSNLLQKQIAHEVKTISNNKVKLVLWGSDMERDYAQKYYYSHFNISYRPFVTVYPFVAKRTLPKRIKKKTDDFSVVYLGSIGQGGYKNYFPYIKKISETGIRIIVYLLNSFHPKYFRMLQKIASKHPNLTVKKFIPFERCKEEISQFHVGLAGHSQKFMKIKATYGMKPLEYAYAGVQPASLGHPIRNLSDGKEFGYCCSPETIEKDYKYNLEYFNWNYHLMDNRLEEFISKIEEIL